MHKRRKLFEGILVGAAAALAALLIWQTELLDRWEYATWSWRVKSFAKPGPDTGRIKIILLDQASVEWGKKQNGLSWPWPREVYTPIIDFCRRHGAKAVIFDVLYSEPSVYGVSDDETLGKTIGRRPDFVGALCLHKNDTFSKTWPPEFSNQLIFKLDTPPEWATSENGRTPASATFPVDEIASSAIALGDVMDEPDLDGVFRRSQLFRMFDNRAVPSLGFASFAVGCSDLSSGECMGKVAKNRLRVCGKSIPVDDEGRMLLRFRGPTGTFQTFSAAAVIESELAAATGGKETVDADSLKGAYVFFGFSAPGLLDLRPTPISNVCPGVEIHATLLDNLLTGDFLRDCPPLVTILTTLLLAMLCSLAVVTFSKRAVHSVAVFACLAPLPVGVGFAAYPLGMWWPIAVQECAVFLALTGAVIVNYATEGRQKAFLKKAFQHYLSPVVIKQLQEDRSRLKLGGERRELTIFFSDLQGFSTFSEKLDPVTLTSLLNDYLSDMTDIILEEGGTLDKYEGDAIIAFWNAPVDQPDHAERACRAAIRCQQKLRERREEFIARTGVELKARIGMNTGVVVVGNMGSRKRFDYTVLGDAANLASRLEGANKAFGSMTMISEATWAQTNGNFSTRRIGSIRVVGRGTPVCVHELRDLNGASSDEDIREFERGLELCSKAKWREALEVFESLPDDPVARVYAEKCRELIAVPGSDWDAVWNLAQK